MRKTSTYARKRRATQAYTFNGAEFLNTITRCRSYSDERLPGGFESYSAQAALKAELLARDAAHDLMTHQRPQDPERAFDILAHALGVAIIRALQIQPDEGNNPALPPLQQGTLAVKRAIQRYRASGAWGMDAKGKEELAEALDVYSEILKASSPAQMVKASKEREKLLLRASSRPLNEQQAA